MKPKDIRKSKERTRAEKERERVMECGVLYVQAATRRERVMECGVLYVQAATRRPRDLNSLLYYC